MTPRDRRSAPDDLFDDIAKLLDPSQREYFYQRMLYFRQLRPDDELLRIVEAIGFLALLIREAPHAVAFERERIATALTTTLASIQAVAALTQAHHQQLEDRMAKLPAAIAEGISPGAIAHAITESLRQQFVHSGLPATAQALAVVAKQLTQATATLQRGADQLAAETGAADEARRALNDIRTSLVHATEQARGAVATLGREFMADYRQAIALLCGGALLVGALLGFGLQSWRAARVEVVPPATVAPASATPAPSAEPHPPTRTPAKARAHRQAADVPTGRGTDDPRGANDPHGTPVEQPWITDGSASDPPDAKPEA
jgi:hypothetical protein